MNAGADLQNSLIENLCRKYSSGRVIRTRAEVVESERARNIEKAELSAAEIVEFRDDEIEAFKEGGEYITSDCFAKMLLVNVYACSVFDANCALQVFNLVVTDNFLAVNNA